MEIPMENKAIGLSPRRDDIEDKSSRQKSKPAPPAEDPTE